jgi:hypothetical protein
MQVVNLHNISFEHNLWAEVCARWPVGWVGGCKGAGWARARWPVGWAGGSSNVGTKGKNKCGGKSNVEEKQFGLSITERFAFEHHPEARQLRCRGTQDGL